MREIHGFTDIRVWPLFVGKNALASLAVSVDPDVVRITLFVPTAKPGVNAGQLCAIAAPPVV
ncbi:hypothetical protein [Burkholderia cepacia]|uniref:hypothetical protein n=1 Tax=Burkholderia cepacia TaxID=292 RepID=UPI000A4B1E47|nr:hypothetical protein [Burkholderia cepacia]